MQTVPVHAQDHDYATAWRCASTNRVDLVTLIAHAWPEFLERAEDLVRAVPHDQDLVDVLSSLQPNAEASGLVAALGSTVSLA